MTGYGEEEDSPSLLENAMLRRSRQYLYQLIVRQLYDDGFSGAATAVANATSTPLRHDIENTRLAQLCMAGIMSERERGGPAASSTDEALKAFCPENAAEDMEISFLPDKKAAGSSGKPNLDLDVDGSSSKPCPTYTTRFIATHKGAVRCAAFSHDGRYAATAATDQSIKLLDVHKMMAHQAHQKTEHDENLARPVLRTYYDHIGSVNDLVFHPWSPFLVSASADTSVKFFDYTKPTVKRSFRFTNDTHAVRSLAFHPSGDFMVLGTEHHMVRLYDCNNFKRYSAANGHHVGPINCVRYGSDGKTFVSCSKDGSIKIWETTTLGCVRTITNAHAGAMVNSVEISANGRYILSSGKDSTCRLWDLSTGKQLRLYTGSTNARTRVHAVFSATEDHVLSSDEQGAGVVVWDTRTGELTHRLQGHTNTVRNIVFAHHEQSFFTCSEDFRARFWSALPPMLPGGVQ